ncbi:MAG TPA: hypothetical protein VG755_01000 [Nannocystaceae bacterium]|nr:hypothetical protein [Nannocystaceae bacterium]
MKALKIIGFIFGAIGLAVFVFWFGWLKAPAAEDVCENVAKVLEKEAGAKMPEELRKECIAQYSREPEFGKVPWVKRLKCIRDAETSKEMEQCEKK